VFTRAGTTLGTGTHVLAVDTWYYVEIKVTVHNSTGSFEVRVGEELDSSGSGIDTQNSANASINQLWFGQTAGAQGTSMAWDDYYVCDDTGAVNNNFLGDLKIECLFPSADGNSSQFDGSDGNSSANYQLVDEVTPNDDTDYVQSADVGDEDTYTYGDLATTTGSVFAVQPIPYARKTDAGSRQIVSTARLSAVETDSLAKSLADTYLYLPDVRETKPGGGSWTITDVNNSEFGVKVSG
jgi:hypothetical protein